MSEPIVQPVQAYKVFNSDWKCRDFQYKLGETYECDKAIPCKEGFHACLKLEDCFSYYPFNSANKVAVVEMSGTIVPHTEDSKIAATKITILKELSWNEVLGLVNTGKDNTGQRNSGDWNSGDWNSGDWNSGYGNSGYGNSGNRNSGDWNSGYGNSGYGNSGNRNSGYGNSGYGNSGYGNSGNRNSGLFNSVEPTIFSFNKPTTIKMSDLLNNGQFPDFYNMQICEWIPEEKMTDKEKVDNPKFYAVQGYLLKRSYKEAWAIWKEKCTPENWAKVLALPNFDAKIFEEITGI